MNIPAILRTAIVAVLFGGFIFWMGYNAGKADANAKHAAASAAYVGEVQQEVEQSAESIQKDSESVSEVAASVVKRVTAKTYDVVKLPDQPVHMDGDFADDWNRISREIADSSVPAGSMQHTDAQQAPAAR